MNFEMNQADQLEKDTKMIQKYKYVKFVGEFNGLFVCARWLKITEIFLFNWLNGLIRAKEVKEKTKEDSSCFE